MFMFVSLQVRCAESGGRTRRETNINIVKWATFTITDICAHIESNNEAISHLPDIPYCKFDKLKEVTLSDTKDSYPK